MCNKNRFIVPLLSLKNQYQHSYSLNSCISSFYSYILSLQQNNNTKLKTPVSFIKISTEFKNLSTP